MGSPSVCLLLAPAASLSRLARSAPREELLLLPLPRLLLAPTPRSFSSLQRSLARSPALSLPHLANQLGSKCSRRSQLGGRKKGSGADKTHTSDRLYDPEVKQYVANLESHSCTPVIELKACNEEKSIEDLAAMLSSRNTFQACGLSTDSQSTVCSAQLRSTPAQKNDADAHAARGEGEGGSRRSTGAGKTATTQFLLLARSLSCILPVANGRAAVAAAGDRAR